MLNAQQCLAQAKSCLTVALVIITSGPGSLITNYLALAWLLPSALRSSSFFFLFLDKLTSVFSPTLQFNDQGTFRFHLLWTSSRHFHEKGKNQFSFWPCSIGFILEDKQKWHTEEGKVQFSLSWNLVLLGGTGDRCFMTGTSCISDFLRMMAGEDPEKQEDLRLFSWKGNFVGETCALPRKWTVRLTEWEELSWSDPRPLPLRAWPLASAHTCLLLRSPAVLVLFEDLSLIWCTCKLSPFGYGSKWREHRKGQWLLREIGTL